MQYRVDFDENMSEVHERFIMTALIQKGTFVFFREEAQDPRAMAAADEPSPVRRPAILQWHEKTTRHSRDGLSLHVSLSPSMAKCMPRWPHVSGDRVSNELWWLLAQFPQHEVSLNMSQCGLETATLISLVMPLLCHPGGCGALLLHHNVLDDDAVFWRP